MRSQRRTETKDVLLQRATSSLFVSREITDRKRERKRSVRLKTSISSYVFNHNLFLSPRSCLCFFSPQTDPTSFCCASPSAIQSRCAIARPCGCRRSAAFVPTRPSCSSAARTICVSCTATRLTCPISRIATRLCGKANDNILFLAYIPPPLIQTQTYFSFFRLIERGQGKMIVIVHSGWQGKSNNNTSERRKKNTIF